VGECHHPSVSVVLSRTRAVTFCDGVTGSRKAYRYCEALLSPTARPFSRRVIWSSGLLFAGLFSEIEYLGYGLAWAAAELSAFTAAWLLMFAVLGGPTGLSGRPPRLRTILKAEVNIRRCLPGGHLSAGGLGANPLRDRISDLGYPDCSPGLSAPAALAG
jgi:hypothetical protein